MEYFARKRLTLTRTAAILAWLLILLSPAPAQGTRAENTTPYFSLQSNQTFPPGEPVSVQLWSQNIQSLDFRVYRVRDPIDFFRQLEDVTSFGDQVRRPHRARTPLEGFHNWKRRWRTWMRNVVREQFTAGSRSAIRRTLLEERQQQKPPTQKYAELPILNKDQLVATWRQSIPKTDHPWQGSPVPVEVPGKGLFLIEAVHDQLRAYTIVFVTDLAVVSKSGPGKVIAYVVNRKTGEPQSGVPLRVWLNREELANQPSGGDGLIDLEVEAQNTDEALVLAKHNDDFAVSQLYAWNLTPNPHEAWNAYIYTDRPVYRPGHMVHAKAILRTRDGSTYKLPDQSSYPVEIQDGMGETVWRGQLRTTDFGTLAFDYELPPDATLGYYSIQVRSGEVTLNGGFHVEEYRKPEYRVQVDVAPRQILQGQSFDAAIQARYYYGEPVANAQVKWVVHRARYWFPLFSEYAHDFDDEGMDDSYVAWEQVTQEQEGKLDAEGRLTIRIPTEVTGEDTRYRIEARVTDAANREISGTGYGLATYGSFALALDTDKYFYQPGDSAKITVRAANYDGDPVATPFRVDLEEWSWEGERMRGPRQQPNRTRIQTVSGQTASDGSGPVTIRLSKSGSYVLRAIARTPEGREITTERHLWVSGSGSWGGDERSIRMIPDKKTYAPGDVARVLLITGAPTADILVTTEGRTLENARVIHADGPTAVVEVPIRDSDTPDVFLAATFIRDNQFYSSAKRLLVPPVDRQLSITIETSKAQYVPGEKAVYRVYARDHLGKPVRAEVSLGVVDEAIYSVRPDTVPDPVKHFYRPGYNHVGTNSSLSYYFRGEAGKRAMPLAQVRPSGYHAQLKNLVQPKIRKAFPDTVFWVADIVTNSSGEAVVETEFPDSLTEFRATARAVTRDTQLGSAVQKVIVRKNMILTLSTPRFLTQGDEVTISAIARNYLETAKQAELSLTAEGLDLIGGAQQQVTIPPRGEAKAEFRFRPKTGAGEAVLLGKALTNEESDAVELRIPVRPYGVPISGGVSGIAGADSTTARAIIAYPADAQPGSRDLEIHLTPSLAGAVFGALEYLTTFPYGCTEQTMSSFLPNLIVEKAMTELNLQPQTSGRDLDRKIQAGIDRLIELRHDDGGWGWWKNDSTDLFMTSYVLLGLGMAHQNGVTVQPHLIWNAAEWLNANQQSEDWTPDLRAFAAYATGFSEAPNPSRDSAWADRGKLSPLGLALLGLDLERAGRRPDAEQLARTLTGKAANQGDLAYWKVEQDYLMHIYADTSPEATAYAVKFLLKLQPENPLIPKAAAWLASHRDQGYYWSSTKQTAMVVLGLTDYLRNTGELNPSFSATVQVNGQSIASQRFASKEALSPKPVTLRIPRDQIQDQNQLTVEFKGEGRLYWSAETRYVTTQPQEVGRGTYKLNVIREYFRLEPTRTNDRIVYDLQPLEGPLHPGDVLAVRLTVTGTDWQYLMLEDPIPAGAEFLQRDDLYEIRNRPSWWNYTFTHKEFHDDHAALFQRHFQAGQQQFVYLLKIVNPGTYQVSPAMVQPMYQPEMLATTTGREVVVE